MNPILLATIAIKIVAIYVMTQGVVQLPGIVAALQYQPSSIDSNNGNLVIYLSALLSPLVFSLALWFIAPTLSRVIIKRADYSQEIDLTTDHLQTVAIATVGFFLLIMSIPPMIGTGIQLFGNMDIVNDEKVFNINLLSYVFVAISKFILGLALILGATGWMRLLNKIRELGLK